MRLATNTLLLATSGLLASTAVADKGQASYKAEHDITNLAQGMAYDMSVSKLALASRAKGGATGSNRRATERQRGTTEGNKATGNSPFAGGSPMLPPANTPLPPAYTTVAVDKSP